MFTPGDPEPLLDSVEAKQATRQEEVVINGPWEFELKPTLDNRWGDFRQPASDGLLGPEARRFAYAEEIALNPGWEKPSAEVSGWRQTTCVFGPRFWKLGPVPPGPDADAVEVTLKGPAPLDPRVPVIITGREYRWQPYEYSLRYGVEGDPGHQGYHGLKAQVGDDFIALGVRRDTMTDRNR